MKTQNQTPKKNDSSKMDKNQTKESMKHAADEKSDQSNNKLVTKKTMQSEEKASKKRTR